MCSAAAARAASGSRATGARWVREDQIAGDVPEALGLLDPAGLLAALESLPVNIAWQARMATLLDVAHDYGEGLRSSRARPTARTG
ncbi:hypothetical protein [Streptomyces sp. NBC_01244]|uniref:hypothetical protein n=1 Tax=Streptomyces sp. NBC_01244 TaxID=2903797 RepID=UPI002E11CE8E|nr:hypothetical protein OG247_02450 [Streptomyces sp. NBC_01244]